MRVKRSLSIFKAILILDRRETVEKWLKRHVVTRSQAGNSHLRHARERE